MTKTGARRAGPHDDARNARAVMPTSRHRSADEFWMDWRTDSARSTKRDSRHLHVKRLVLSLRRHPAHERDVFGYSPIVRARFYFDTKILRDITTTTEDKRRDRDYRELLSKNSRQVLNAGSTGWSITRHSASAPSRCRSSS